MSLSPPQSPVHSSLSPPSDQPTASSSSAPAQHGLPNLGGRARSGSRTWEEAQQAAGEQLADDAQRARDEGPEGNGAISAGELRAEMETLLSLRRRSLSQPVNVDPDLPPPSPTSPTHSHHPSSPSSSRPQLTLQIIPAQSPTGGPVSPTAPSPAESGTLVRRRSSVSTRLPLDHPLPSPPLPSPTSATGYSPSPSSPEAASQASQDLFWLPASLHPELAPQEFKAFIREQTRPDALARRTSMGGRGGYAGAGGSGRMDRKKSMLRGEYKPRQDDGVGEGGARERRPEGLSRTASEGSKRTTTRVDFEELTIRDLQRLEELAAHAESEGSHDGEEEGERLGRVLRRSLSLNPNLVAAAAAGAHLPLSSEPSLAEASSSADSDSPLIVHSPGQILRRTARTKIRKAGLVGDGGGHRFGPSRRVRSASSDLGGAVDGDDESIGGNTSVDSLESGEALQVASEIVDGDPGGRSLSSSPSSDNQHEVQYFEDAPAIDMDDFPPTAIDGAWLDQPVGAQPPSSVNLDAPLPPKPSSDASPARPPLHSPPSLAPPASAPSPASADYDWSTHHQPSPQQQQLPPSQPYVPPPPLPASAPLPERKESIPPSAPTTSSAASRASSFSSEGGKKKSGWARLGLGVKGAAEDKDKKKGKKGEKEMEKVMEATSRQQQLDREKEAREVRDREEKERKERERELSSKEKEGAGGSSFFGGLFGKRKSEQEPVAPPTPSPPPEVRTPPPPPTASGALAPNGRYINFYRLPIHVERAVYRLSHIKLANPRRPLYEQVLISNLMFWYLSIINKPAAPPPPAPTPIPVPVPQMRGEEPHQQQHQAQPHQERQSERTSSNQKRAGLSKPAAEGSRRSGNRSAEMPVRQPQFGEQNRQIEQEYSDGRDHQQQHSSPQPSSAPRQHQHHHQSHPPLQPHQHHQQQSPIPHVVVAPSPPTTADFASSSQHSTSRSPERASAPANMYRVASTSSDSLSSTDDGNQDDDDDDRPLGSMPTHRESYPPNRPIPVTSYPKHEAGFQVTSRRVSPTPPASSSSAVSAEENQRRRVSSVSAISAVSSTGSFDASEIIDAYSSGGGGGAGTSPATSPVLSFKEGMVGAGELGVGGAVGRAGVAEVTHAPLFGNVAPRRRGDSLVNRGEAKGADELARVRSRSPPLVGAGGAGGEFR